MIRNRFEGIRKVFLPLAVIVISACSASRPMLHRYRDLNGEAKRLFISHYPQWSPDERQEFLNFSESSGLDSELWVQLWRSEIASPEDALYSEKRRAFISRGQAQTLVALELEVDPPEPIQAGSSVRLRAFARYENKNRVEATQDVTWKVLPAVAFIEDFELYFECLHSDIVVSANFLDERESSKQIRIRKALRSLTLELSEASLISGDTDDYQLKLVAHCQDGSSTDVSCQAHWKNLAEGIELNTCGRIRWIAETPSKERRVNVMASYGNLKTVKQIELPQKR